MGATPAPLRYESWSVLGPAVSDWAHCVVVTAALQVCSALHKRTLFARRQ